MIAINVTPQLSDYTVLTFCSVACLVLYPHAIASRGERCNMVSDGGKTSKEGAEGLGANLHLSVFNQYFTRPSFFELPLAYLTAM